MSDAVPAIRLRQLFGVFFMVGVTSFGGGLTGWIFREAVERRRWLTEQDFLAGLSLSRAMPGLNVVNLSIWVGFRLRGAAGAAAAVAAVLSGPMVLIVLCAMAWRRWGDSLAVHQVLAGITAAALGLSLSLGLKSLRPASPAPFYGLIAALVFVGVGVLRWPMLWVVGGLAPPTVLWSFLVDRDREG